MPKFCEYCGAPLNEGAKFCTGCGHPVTQPSRPSTPSQPSTPTPTPNYHQPDIQQPEIQQPPKKKGTRGMIMLTVLLAMFVGAGAGVIYQYKAGKLGTKSRPEPSAAATTTAPDQGEPQPSQAEEKPQKSKAKDEPKKSKVKSKIKIKDEEFFGVTMPIPDIGKIIENKTEKGSGGEEVATIRIDSISYQEFIEYCKTLESLRDWKATKTYRVSRFPKDYNEEPMVICAGSYGELSNITVKYYSDELCEDPETPHFNLTVGKLH